MRNLHGYLIIILLPGLLLFGCDNSNLTAPEYPLPESGIYTSDPLDYPFIISADTSPDGDLFVLASYDSLAMDPDSECALIRISPYGQTLFQTGYAKPPGVWIEATADFGCISHDLLNSTKTSSTGAIGWETLGSSSAVVPRSDGSVVLAGPACDEDSVFHVAAVNQLGIMLWETTFPRAPRRYFNQGCITPDGTIALVEIFTRPFIGIPEWPVVQVGGIYLVAEDGSDHSYLPNYPGFASYCLDFAAVQEGGFLMAGIGQDDYLTHIIEVSSAGTTVWDYVFQDRDEAFVGFKLTPDAGLSVLTTTINQGQMTLRYFDADRTLLLTREYGNLEQPIVGLDLAVLADSRIQLAGLNDLGEVVIIREELGL